MVLWAVFAASAAAPNTSAQHFINVPYYGLSQCVGLCAWFSFLQRPHMCTQLDISLSIYDGSLKRYAVLLCLLWSDIRYTIRSTPILFDYYYIQILLRRCCYFSFFSEDSRKEYLLTLTPKWNDILKRRNENITLYMYRYIQVTDHQSMHWNDIYRMQHDKTGCRQTLSCVCVVWLVFD